MVFSVISLTVGAQSIYRTACNGNLARLDSLLTNTSIDIKDSRGRSLMHWTVACKKKEVFDYLIKKGINLNPEDNQKKTPIHVTVQFENEKYFDLLVKLQPNTHWVDKYGTSLLEMAVLNKSKVFVRKLIELGVDVNNKNERGSTPLEISNRINANEIYALLLSLGADESKIRTFTMYGKYMGQQPPGTTPKLFAPNFISTEEQEFGSVFNSSGTEFYYAVDVNGKNEIRYSKMIGNQWSTPQTILSHERYGYNDPFLSNDENRLYFISKRALDGIGDLKDVDIWYVERVEGGWSQPINAGPNINTDGNEYYISFTNNGTMYFSSNGHPREDVKRTDHDIYYSKLVDKEFQRPVSLDDAVNTENYEADVFVSPDESYIIFCSTRENGFGRGDLYISFKNSDNTWTTAINMGREINTKHYEYCPYITKDGKYLFYTSNQDIYWVSTKILNEIKEKNK
ncbi:hypothetical protein GCM10022258_22370 [Aquimarina gracilis]